MKPSQRQNSGDMLYPFYKHINLHTYYINYCACAKCHPSDKHNHKTVDFGNLRYLKDI